MGRRAQGGLCERERADPPCAPACGANQLVVEEQEGEGGLCERERESRVVPCAATACGANQLVEEHRRRVARRAVRASRRESEPIPCASLRRISVG